MAAAPDSGIPTPGSSRHAQFLACGAGMVAFGIVLALLGTLFGLPAMRARLAVNLVQQGDLFLLLFLGVLAASLASGPLIDSLGNKLVLVVSGLLVTLALGGFVVAQSFAAAAISAIVLGVGGGGLNTSTNALVSELYGDERGKMLNILGMFYGIGALAIPLLSASLAAVFSFLQLLVFAAVLTALTTLAYAVLRFPPARQPRRFPVGELLKVARSPGVPLLAALLFCQSGNEAAIGGWTSSYVGSLGFDARTATWVLAGYWAALMLGRLLAARLLRVLSDASLVLWSGVGSVIGCGVLLGVKSLEGTSAGAALIGLSFAAIYPTTLAIAGDRYPHLAGSVFGLLFSVGILGGMSYPWAIGRVGYSLGLRPAMLLPLVSAAAICALAAVIRARLRPRRPPTPTNQQRPYS